MSQDRPPFRALIIDDDPDLLLLVRRTLEFTASWEVHTASSGHAGIELARALRPDAVLVDIMMPEIDGYEICRRLRADESTARIPLVLLTARRETHEPQGAAAGIAGILYKPFEPDTLAQQILDLCR